MVMCAEKTLYVARKPEDFLPILFHGLFGNEHPVEVEIGCGKGKFLIFRAVENPGINFLGMDYAGKWMKIGQTRGEKKAIRNLKFIKGEAKLMLGRLRPESITVFHVYFPDPWPKRRHYKRRLLTPGFLRQLHGLLCQDGLIEIATDDRDYFSAIQSAVRETSGFWRLVREGVNERLAFGTTKTNYEIKYEAEKRPIYYLELKK